MSTKARAGAIDDQVAKSFLNDQRIWGVGEPRAVFISQCAFGYGGYAIAIRLKRDALMFTAD